MKELLKQVSVADYTDFRRRVCEVCGLKYGQFWSRVNGKTKVSPAERIVIQKIIDEEFKDGQ